MPTLLAVVKKRGLLTLMEAASLTAGEPIRGSWWGHPKGKEIFRALSELEDEEDVRGCKLVEGKQTFAHRRLWPAVIRVAAERSLFKPPSTKARAAIKDLGAKLDRKVREELERSLLVIGKSEHTAKGRHEVRLVKFADAFPAEARVAAAKLSVNEAIAALELAGWSGHARTAKR